MKLLKNVSIVVKTLIPIVFLSVLLFVSVVISSGGMKNILNASKEVSDNYAASMAQLGDIAADFEELEKVAYAHCIADSDQTMDSLEKEAKNVADEIDSLCSEFERTLDEGEEADAFAEFRTMYAAFYQTL